MAQRIVNGEQYEAFLIGGDVDGTALDIEGLHGTSAFSIAPNDSADLASITNAVYVGFTGNVNLVCSGNTTPVVFFNVPGGSILPLKVKRVYASGTTASGLVGIV